MRRPGVEHANSDSQRSPKIAPRSHASIPFDRIGSATVTIALTRMARYVHTRSSWNAKLEWIAR